MISSSRSPYAAKGDLSRARPHAEQAEQPFTKAGTRTPDAADVARWLAGHHP